MATSEFDFLELFPVVIFKANLVLPHEEIAEYTKNFIEGIPKYSTYFDLKQNRKWVIGLPHMKELSENIMKCCHLYMKQTNREIGDHRVRMWGNVYKKGDWHESHIHPLSILSGTYYPHSDENSADITFYNPNQGNMMMDPAATNRGTIKWGHAPRTGDLLIWPSWLPHCVRPQKDTDSPRVSISFNFN